MSELDVQPLEREVPAELEVLDLVDVTHATATEMSQDLVAAADDRLEERIAGLAARDRQ
jgi:hypothetical protein